MNGISHYSNYEQCPEFDDAVVSRAVQCISGETCRTFGDIRIEHSRHVRIGDQNFYNAPVNIRQVFNSRTESRSIYSSVRVSTENVCTLKDYDEFNDPVVLKKNAKGRLKPWLLTSAAIALSSLILSVALFYILTVWKNSGIHDNNSNSKGSVTTSSYLSFLTSTNLTDSGDFISSLVSRSEWNATEYNYDREELHRPEFVIFSHTGYYLNCFYKFECSAFVRNLQKIDRDKHQDVKYNFLIGGDGNIYEGRG